MNGKPNQTRLQRKRAMDTGNELTRSYRMAAMCFTFMIIVALAMGLSLMAKADTTPKLPSSETHTTDMATSMHFFTGIVKFTWTYDNKNTMPFTEQYEITSAQSADAAKRKRPIQITTPDGGELLIRTNASIPGVVLSARHYTDWTLVSALRNSDNPGNGVGVFKFCSRQASVESCASSVLDDPDGTVTLSMGSTEQAVTRPLEDLRHPSIKDELLGLLSL